MLERYDSQIRRSDLDNKHKRKNSQLSLDPRHSGGTAYSTASISTPQAHSREVSNASNTSSIPRALGLPVRNSSISSKIAKSSQVVVPQTLDTIINLGRDIQPRSSLMSENSGNASPIFYGTAEFARGYTSQLPSPMPAPTRNLPEVPNRSLKEEVESHSVPYFVSQPSSPSPLGIQEINSRVVKHQTNSKPPVPSQRGRDDVIGSARQARKERVKAKKERDIAALRETKSKRVALSDISREPSLNIRPSTAPSLPVDRRKPSTEKSQHQNKNSLTDIMVVAELAPFTGNVYISDWALRPPKKPTKLQKHDSLPTSNNSRPQESHTPRSMKFAGGSDSETLPRMITRERKYTPPLRSSKSKLDMRREQRRTKRNSLLREKEVDARLSKIEKDNAILLHAMSGMAKNFSGLSHILVQERMEEQDKEEQNTKRMRTLEPVMRQSQDPARRTGSEKGRTNGIVY
ncbi:hypothetical protein B0O99DRAFT_252570 [Bisporella sp. PMI_857]|nr:hypothetical protein B0O99DRAFT_252570 [Bisporella sp. PMI_857]